MAKANTERSKDALVIPLFGKDEMNLIEFPIGPITPGSTNTLEVDHFVRDPETRKEVSRRLIITGSDYGLPRPIDDRVLVGLQALTHESGFQSREVSFSVYHLCRTLGWEPSGRSYQRLEESFDRILGTNFKFKDAWYDKGEKEFRSRAFHLIESYELCTKNRYGQARMKTGQAKQPLCSFVWNEVVWKSFEDGNIRTLDMVMFRRVANGRSRDVALRLFRWLAKQFYNRPVVKIDVMKLSVGTLGLAASYPSEAMRALERAGNVLIECGFMAAVRFKRSRTTSGTEVCFFETKRKSGSGNQNRLRNPHGWTTRGEIVEEDADDLQRWLDGRTESELMRAEEQALFEEFGTSFERDKARREGRMGVSIKASSRVRQEFVRRFLDPSRQQFWEAAVKSG